MAGLVEAAQLLDIKMDQLARSLALVAAHGFGRVDPGQLPQPLAPEPAGDGRSRQPEPGGNRGPGHPQAPAQMQDLRHRRPGQRPRNASGGACAVRERRSPACAEPGEPFAQGADRNAKGRSHLHRGLARTRAGNACSRLQPVRRAFRCGLFIQQGPKPEFGDCSLTPQPGEQPPEISQPEPIR